MKHLRADCPHADPNSDENCPVCMSGVVQPPIVKKVQFDEEQLRKEFQEFADGIAWRSDDDTEVFIGIGNMADWWIEKIKGFTNLLTK